MKIFFYTLGCKANQYDTDAMINLFQEKGHTIVSSGDHADVCVINTCTVTGVSDRKSRSKIRQLRAEYPEAIIVATGCYTQAAGDDVQGADIVIGNAEKKDIVQIIESYKSNRVKIISDINSVSNYHDLPIAMHGDKTRAFLKIQEGCENNCTYCIIPSVRGRVRSRSLESIRKQAQMLADNGYKEIVLTGINLSAYGKDISLSLIDALQAVDQVDGIQRIRIGSLEMNLIDDVFVDRLAQVQKLCKHFHMSLQSGSDTVLKRMNRRYTTGEFYTCVQKLRAAFPSCTITTDIIVGFPEETDQEFRKTCDFVKKLQLMSAHIFPYSKRKGTPAFHMKQVDSKIKKQRVQILTRIVNHSRLDFYNSLIGTMQQVLVEEGDQGEYIGYSAGYFPVKINSQSNLKNKLCDVKIIGIDKDGLIGTLVKEVL